MTTDRTSADDHAARLEALRQRRAASRPASPADTAEPTAAIANPGRRARRHAATGGRILAGSVSAAAALALMGAMANATNPSTDAPTTTTGDDTAVPTVIVIRRPAGATEVAAPGAPRVTPTVAAPVTTSRGS
jgi:hypothetical protein